MRRSRALHFELGGKLHLHWLRDRIALLARDTRWAAMARAALRDDLFSLHAELTTDVLRDGQLEAWLEPQAGRRSTAPRRSSVRPRQGARRELPATLRSPDPARSAATPVALPDEDAGAALNPATS